MLGLRVRRPARPVLLPQANRLLPQVNEAVDAEQPGHTHNTDSTIYPRTIAWLGAVTGLDQLASIHQVNIVFLG
jgi:hypothetical protein